MANAKSEAMQLIDQLFSQEEHFGKQTELIDFIQESLAIKSFPKLSVVHKKTNSNEENLKPMN